ncbi:MAG: anti-sigma factor family protein [Alphaproteobacteria bacterium]
MKCEEARELITALVDDELTPVERFPLEAHLGDCALCQRVYEQERALKHEIRRIGRSISAPAELKRKILTRHGISPAEAEPLSAWFKLAMTFRPHFRPAVGLVLVLIVLLPIIYLVRPRSEPISLAALEIEQKIAAGEIALHKATTPNELRDWQTRSVQSKFAPMEYDLSSINLLPVGGVVEEVNGRKMLVTVYSGNNLSVTCFTFLGTEEDAPSDAATLLDTLKMVKFYTFSKNGLNAVFHRKGDVICLLVSKMSMEELVSIATAKVESS